MNRYSKIKFEDMDVCMKDLLKICLIYIKLPRPSFFAQFFHALQVGGSNIDSIHNANNKYRL